MLKKNETEFRIENIYEKSLKFLQIFSKLHFCRLISVDQNNFLSSSKHLATTFDATGKIISEEIFD